MKYVDLALVKLNGKVHVLEAGPEMRPYRTLCGTAVTDLPDGCFVTVEIECGHCEMELEKRRPDNPRPMTEDEMRARFLRYVRALIDYWLNEERRPGAKEKLEGLAFSILSTIDGRAVEVPGFKLIPDPHEDDAKHCRYLRENWWKSIDISGGLHDQLARER